MYVLCCLEWVSSYFHLCSKAIHRNHQSFFFFLPDKTWLAPNQNIGFRFFFKMYLFGRNSDLLLTEAQQAN